MPNDPNYRFHTHQDYPFNKDRLTLVIWIPLQSEYIGGHLMVAPNLIRKKLYLKLIKF